MIKTQNNDGKNIYLLQLFVLYLDINVIYNRMIHFTKYKILNSLVS